MSASTAAAIVAAVGEAIGLVADLLREGKDPAKEIQRIRSARPAVSDADARLRGRLDDRFPEEP